MLFSKNELPGEINNTDKINSFSGPIDTSDILEYKHQRPVTCLLKKNKQNRIVHLSLGKGSSKFTVFIERKAMFVWAS